MLISFIITYVFNILKFKVFMSIVLKIGSDRPIDTRIKGMTSSSCLLDWSCN